MQQLPVASLAGNLKIDRYCMIGGIVISGGNMRQVIAGMGMSDASIAQDHLFLEHSAATQQSRRKPLHSDEPIDGMMQASEIA